MARLFPLRSEAPTSDGAPRVVDLDDEDADAVFGALSSSTARRIYARLDDEPGTPSDVADAIDSSIQNVRYHLEKLEDAGLVEVVDTWYSSRGNEMSVYATSNGPLIVSSDRSRAEQLKQAVARYVGGVGVLAAASLVVQAAAQRFGALGTDDASAAGGDGEFVSQSDGDGDAVTTGADDGGDAGAAGAGDDDGGTEYDGPTEDADSLDAARDGSSSGEPDGPFEWVADTTLDAVDGLFSGLSPGMLFFLGGLVVLTAILAWWYATSYRHVTD